MTSEHGNALWFILIAVVLLGALTMILSRGGTSVNQSGDVEQLRIKSGQILRYTKSIEAAIQQMIQIRGISENNISFENATTATDYTNTNCTSNDCKIFNVEGGGMAYKNFSGINDGSDWIFNSSNNVGTSAGPIGTTAAGTGNDLLMLLPNVDTDLCIQINRDLSVGTAGTLPTDAGGIDTSAFTGAYASGGPTILDGDPTPFELDKHNAGCFTDTLPNPDVTYFYYVLLAR